MQMKVAAPEDRIATLEAVLLDLQQQVALINAQTREERVAMR
ncbi:MAG TPA: hypothetical protein VKG05_13460 [Steroidobacteraceae bacterium]|nr:hypothetical protein [Steroidobacteraceae bacterium]